MPMLTPDDHHHYHRHGWLRLPGLFDLATTVNLRQDLDVIARDWGAPVGGWEVGGDVRKPADSSLLVMQQLEHYSPAWDAARRHAPLVQVAGELLAGKELAGKESADKELAGGVEYLGSSTHSKPARSGAPFPMHQDSRYYEHADPRLLICMLHLDDTDADMGPIAFAGGWQERHLPHVDEVTPGRKATYLDPAAWPIDAATPVTCRAGDVVIFNIFTIHGSQANLSDRPRRAVVFRYRHPDNRQVREGLTPVADGRDRFGWMVAGTRPPRPGFAAPAGGEVDRPIPRAWLGQP